MVQSPGQDRADRDDLGNRNQTVLFALHALFSHAGSQAVPGPGGFSISLLVFLVALRSAWRVALPLGDSSYFFLAVLFTARPLADCWYLSLLPFLWAIHCTFFGRPCLRPCPWRIAGTSSLLPCPWRMLDKPACTPSAGRGAWGIARTSFLLPCPWEMLDKPACTPSAGRGARRIARTSFLLPCPWEI